MVKSGKRKQQAKILRIARKLHRISGISLFLFFFIVSVTTLLLGWKKDSNYLLAATQTGSTPELKEWLSLDSLSTIAEGVMKKTFEDEKQFEVDRMDVRQKDGIVKVSFKDTYWGLQLDGATGETLDLSVRRADFIEDIHDGSIVDDLLQTDNEIFKLFYTTLMGFALFLFTATGFWLWYGPKRMKRK